LSLTSYLFACNRIQQRTSSDFEFAAISVKMGYSRNSFLLVVIFLITNLLFTESFSSIQKDSYRRVIASNNKIFMGTDKTFNQLEKLTKKLF